MMIAAVSATLLAAVIYLFITPPRYTATTMMVLDAKHQPVQQSDEKVAEGQPNDEAVVSSQIETIKSENIATAVIKKLKLTEDAEFRPHGIRAALNRWIGKGATDKTADSDEEGLRTAIGTLKSGLSVTRVPKSYVVEIAYTSLNPKKATSIANAIADAYIDDQLQVKSEATKRARLWLQQGIAELRATATEAFKNIQDFKSQNNLLVSGDGKMAMDVEIEQLTESLARARAETTLAQSRLGEIDAVLGKGGDSVEITDGAVPDALINPVITKYRQQYLDDEKLATEYGVRYGTNHQAVIKLRTEMADLKRAMHEEMQRIAETYKSELKVTQSREQAIEKRLKEIFQNDSGNRQAEVELKDLETAANTYRSVYEEFLNRYTQTVQQQSFPSAEARIITFASVGEKTSPRTLMTLLLATIGGLNLGAAAMFVREQLHRHIYTRDQLARELGVNCIAAFPLPERPKKALHLIFPSTILNELSTQNETDIPTLLFDDRDPFSITSEALRNIEVAIDLRRISHETRTLAIVSASAGEGKSSIALSLAAMIGRAGRKVLLVDCDFRNPTLTRFLGLQNGIGIVELLSGEAKLTDVTYHNNQYGFDFLCGPTKIRPARIANILHSEPMRNLFMALKEHYDYVIVDLPPILPVIDVRACAHLFDSFVLVAE